MPTLLLYLFLLYAPPQAVKSPTCECGAFHPFEMYVYAHWDIRLVHECDKCHAKHSVRFGRARLTRKGKGAA